MEALPARWATVVLMATQGGTPLLERRHLRRQCVQCGLSAEAILATNGTLCPRCGCDLVSRPPKSYAEMEGLLEMEVAPAASDALVRVRSDAAAARWLLVLVAVAAVSIAAVLGALLLAGR